MKRHEALLSIQFGGEVGLAVAKQMGTGKYLVGNIPSSPVSNMWALNSKYGTQQAAIKALRLLASDAGKELQDPTEERPGIVEFEFVKENE